MRKNLKKIIIWVGLSLALVGVIGAATSNNIYNDIITDKTYRDGVMRFHDGMYGEAATFFLDALKNRPGDARIHAWLGRSYFHAGYEDVAYEQWKIVNNLSATSPALESFLAYLISRQGSSEQIGEDQNFVQVHTTKNTSPVIPLFRRPSTVIPLPGGTSLVSSFGTNAIVVVDANGKVIRSIRGGVTRLQGPFAMTLIDGKRLFVTQFLSDEIFELSLDGNVINRFGKHGIKPGEFSGPQYLATDNKGYLYVSDIGNRRVQKFDLDGNFVLEFGEKNEVFDGLERPTGVFWMDESLFVVDARKKSVSRLLRFDDSGNMTESIEDDRFKEVEGLSEYKTNTLLVPSRNKLYSFDIASTQFTELYDFDSDKSRFTSTIMDVNGNLIASNFDNEEVQILSKLEGVYSGLHVQVQRITAQKFPEVEVQIAVTDNTGRPILGLDESNFDLTEDKGSLKNLSLIAAGYRTKEVDAMVMLESSSTMQEMRDNGALSDLVDELYKELGTDAKIAISSTGPSPALETPFEATVKTAQTTLRTIQMGVDWIFDRGLRFAVPNLIRAQGLKHIVFVSSGVLPENSFANFGLQETLAYLRNNQIRFSVIAMKGSQIDPGLEYLVRESGGTVIDRYQPTGLQGLGRKLSESREGTYSFSYISNIDSDLGRKYLPLEVEVHVFSKSGRDEIGYFAPIDFADGTRLGPTSAPGGGGGE